MKYLLSTISALFISSSLFGIAGKAGPGCCLKSCRSNCDQHQSVTTSEYNACIKKCDEYFEKIALQAETPTVTVIQVPVKNAPKAPKAPPAAATVKTAAVVKKAETPVAAPAKAAAPAQKQDTTPKA